MRTFRPAENGWLAGEPNVATLDRAKARLAENDAAADAVGANRLFESDLRWVGFLGEIGFSRWLTDELIPHEWNGGVDNLPDFSVGAQERPTSNAVGLKTRYSKVATRADFYAVVPAQHFARQQETEWFFANYEVGSNRLVLLGGVDAERFREYARYVDTGEPIGPTTKAKNPVWQLDVSVLDPPERWLCNLTGHALDGTSCRCGAFSL